MAGQHTARTPSVASDKAASCVCCLPRRDVLSGFAAIAASAAAPAAGDRSGAGAARQGRPHRRPPPFRAARLPRRPSANYLNDRSTVPQQIEEMDKSGVALSVISISVSGPRPPRCPRCAKILAHGATNSPPSSSPTIPAASASSPICPFPDIDGTLKEIEYALDTLKADGVYLRTNYGDKFLGDPMFAPVFEELNRRRAVLYTHPTSHPCCEQLVPGLRDADIEYGTNTTRAIAKFVFSGCSRRYPNMRVIWSHAGGTMPFLIRRFDKRVKESPEFQPILPEGFSPEVRKIYYDIAQAPERAPMAALKAVAPVSQMLFGTDWPHLTTEEHVAGLQNCGVFNRAELKAIDRDNALR